jgi:hypothetical protein
MQEAVIILLWNLPDVRKIDMGEAPEYTQDRYERVLADVGNGQNYATA